MENLSEFFDFVLHVAFWAVVIHFCRVALFGKVEAVVEEEAEKLKEKLSKMIHRIEQEKHGDVYYWFDRDSNEFLAQGKTDDEMINHVKSRFPTHIFIFDDNKAMRGPDWKLVPIQELTRK